MTCMRILIRLITDADPVFWFTVYLMRIRFRILDWCGSGSRLQNDGNPDPQHCFNCVRISSFSAIAYLLVPLADDHKLLLLINQGFGSESVSGSAWIRINLSSWIWIRIHIHIADLDPGGQKLPTKIEKRTEFSSFEVLDVLFWGLEGFSCSLGVLYGGLGISKLQFLIKKIKQICPAVNFS